MGLVGKIKRFARSKAGAALTGGVYNAAEGLRHRFEKKTSLGKAIRNMYHPTYSASSYASSAYGQTGSIVGRY